VSDGERPLDLALPYTWRQELGEVDIVVPVPRGTRARELAVTIQKKQLSVGIKGKDKILDGELCKEIKVEDSTWTLGKRIYVVLCFASHRHHRGSGVRRDSS
jgi:hypothetical protein